MAHLNFTLDTRRATNSGKFPIKLKITHKGQRRYYKLKSNHGFVTESEWAVLSGNQVPKQYNKLIQDMKIQEGKALTVINSLPEFSFQAYDAVAHPKVKNEPVIKLKPQTLKDLFDEYTEALTREERLGYCEQFFNAIRCLTVCNKGKYPDFKDITVEFLKAVQYSFTSRGKSLTTVGIHLRNLRTVMNIAKERELITQKQYPFGKSKYQIPVGKNVKKAITIDSMEALYNLECITEKEQIARDMFYFSYLYNGMNMKDIFQLKKSDIQDGCISFRRAKTIRHNNLPIVIPINTRVQAIIDRHSVARGKMLFPWIDPSLSAYDKYNKLKTVTKLVNEGLETLTTRNGMKKVTTYSARHSFATVLQRKGVPISYISEALGHASLNTSQNYLGGFDILDKQKYSHYLIQ